MGPGNRTFSFEELERAPLVVDAIYKGGAASNVSAEPIHRLLPGSGNSGGFRIVRTTDGSRRIAYVVVFSTDKESEWPDVLDPETGRFSYYGDNRRPGNEVLATRHGGNRMLEEVFAAFHEGRQREVPPFLVFRGTGSGRDVKFLGLAAPGFASNSPAEDLISAWYMLNGERFRNLRAVFTILRLDEGVVSREWIDALRSGSQSEESAPKCWREFARRGRPALESYSLRVIPTIPSKEEQLPEPGSEGESVVRAIYDRFTGSGKSNAVGFEPCAVAIVKLMDKQFAKVEVTRPRRDGGRDAIGQYHVGSFLGHPLRLSFMLEAKCYGRDNGVGVKETSRLIARLKHREFGVFVTTSYIASQAYGEIIEDKVPLLVITGRDIARILIANGIGESNIREWLGQF